MCPPTKPRKKNGICKDLCSLYTGWVLSLSNNGQYATGNKSDTKHKCQLTKHIRAPKFETKKMADNKWGGHTSGLF